MSRDADGWSASDALESRRDMGPQRSPTRKERVQEEVAAIKRQRERDSIRAEAERKANKKSGWFR